MHRSVPVGRHLTGAKLLDEDKLIDVFFQSFPSTLFVVSPDSSFVSDTTRKGNDRSRLLWTTAPHHASPLAEAGGDDDWY